jgi:uncharacterized protein (DUF2147 family)
MKPGIARRHFAASLMAMLLLLMTGFQYSEASRVDGAWIIGDLVLNIFDCQHLVCGRIAWLKEPARRHSQCGKTIVWGLESRGPNEWAGGSILDPDDGHTYRLSAELATDGTLRARIFEGIPIFGKTEILQRTDVRFLTERC